MNVMTRLSGLLFAGSLLLAGCATTVPTIQPAAAPQTLTMTQAQPGQVTVPLAIPALERSTQYLYNKNYLNTIEVRLRDSLGNESVQVIARNAYLAGSSAAGTVNLTFYNVMPGTFTLTVRTSHRQLVGATATIEYDGIRDVFYADANNDNLFNTGDTEYPLVSGNKSAYYLVFAGDAAFTTALFPASERQNATSIPAGFGLGGATGSIVAGQTTAVSATVAQPVRWGDQAWVSTREVSAGEPVTLSVANADQVLAADQVLVAENGANGYISNDNGLFNFLRSNLNQYAPTVDTGAGTVTFTPTRATSTAVNSAPSEWYVHMARGAATSELGQTTFTNAPKLMVWPAAMDPNNSYALQSSPYGPSNLYYNLRDSYGNLVLGNLSGINEMTAATLRRANSTLTAPDFTVVTYATTADSGATANLRNTYPFLVPGKTVGTMAGNAYSQGSVTPTWATQGATYSVNPGTSPVRVTRLEVPYHTYLTNTGAFSSNTPTYVLNVASDPNNGSNFWVSLKTQGTNVVVASSSISQSATGNLQLAYITASATTLPTPCYPTQGFPVVLNTGTALTLTDDGTTFAVSNLGSRKINDTDTVRVRALLNKTNVGFSKDLTLIWK